jgi:hypothetical protein
MLHGNGPTAPAAYLRITPEWPSDAYFTSPRGFL